MITIIELLKENRVTVISRYNRASKQHTSIKNFMNLVIKFFDEHPGITRKCLKKADAGDTYEFIYQLNKACDFAAYIADAPARRQNAIERYNNVAGAETLKHQNYL